MSIRDDENNYFNVFMKAVPALSFRLLLAWEIKQLREINNLVENKYTTDKFNWIIESNCNINIEVIRRIMKKGEFKELLCSLKIPSEFRNDVLRYVHNKGIVQFDIGQNGCDGHRFVLCFINGKYYYIDAYIDRKKLTFKELSKINMCSFLENLFDYIKKPKNNKWARLFDIKLASTNEFKSVITPPNKPVMTILSHDDNIVIDDEHIKKGILDFVKVIEDLLKVMYTDKNIESSEEYSVNKIVDLIIEKNNTTDPYELVKRKICIPEYIQQNALKNKVEEYNLIQKHKNDFKLLNEHISKYNLTDKPDKIKKHFPFHYLGEFIDYDFTNNKLLYANGYIETDTVNDDFIIHRNDDLITNRKPIHIFKDRKYIEEGVLISMGRITDRNEYIEKFYHQLEMKLNELNFLEKIISREIDFISSYNPDYIIMSQKKHKYHNSILIATDVYRKKNVFYDIAFHVCILPSNVDAAIGVIKKKENDKIKIANCHVIAFREGNMHVFFEFDERFTDGSRFDLIKKYNDSNENVNIKNLEVIIKSLNTLSGASYSIDNGEKKYEYSTRSLTRGTELVNIINIQLDH